jgi:hypothetical protein
MSRAELQQVRGIQLAEYRDACWFADVWTKHCLPGMHLRGIHYRLVSVGTVTMAAGVRPHEGRGRPAADPVLDAICLPYENNAFCWLYLQKAALSARYHRLVDARDFEEHRSPKPEINTAWRETPTPGIELPLEWPEDGFPQPEVTGYDYSNADQPITVEVVCEKSTMDDILAPLCRVLRVNYQPLTGMFSTTRLVEMLCRAQKPAVVLYISDLDAAGCNMPTAFAEALSYYQPIYAPHIDIKLKQIALTEAQVVRYGLPRNVIDKEKESPYNRQFRAEHPLGPCELDALEAIRPGELARLVREAVRPYFDKRFSFRLNQAHDDAQAIVDEEWDAQTETVRRLLETIERDMDAIRARRDEELAPHEKIIAEIRARYDEDLRPHEEQRDAVRQEILDQTIAVDLPSRPEPEIQVPEDEWLCALEATK